MGRTRLRTRLKELTSKDLPIFIGNNALQQRKPMSRTMLGESTLLLGAIARTLERSLICLISRQNTRILKISILANDLKHPFNKFSPRALCLWVLCVKRVTTTLATIISQ